jgi:UDPglucose 6-dehydrogenase
MGGLFAESDMESLARLAQKNGVSLKVLAAAREVNQRLADSMTERISRYVQPIQNKDVGILGLAFKPNTNSVAGSAAVGMAKNLIAKGARVRAYDPVALPEAQVELAGSVQYCDTAYGAAEGVDALVVGTGWPEFRELDFARIKNLLRRPLIVDTKNLLDSVRLRAMGFEYAGVGRG